MSAPRIRSDYEGLRRIAQVFAQESASLGQAVNHLKSCKSTLERGDWIGQAAKAFNREMDEHVLPALQRLVAALDMASQSTRQISGLMKTAEGEASKILGTQAGPGGAVAGARGGAAADWAWRKNYRVWEANRKIFLSPENYLEPEPAATGDGHDDQIQTSDGAGSAGGAGPALEDAP